MCQVILRDLRPLLYPPPSSSPTSSLLHYNTAGYDVIDVDNALRLWDPKLPKLLRANADLDWVAWQADLHLSEQAAAVRRPRGHAPETQAHFADHARELPAVSARLGLPVKVRFGATESGLCPDPSSYRFRKPSSRDRASRPLAISSGRSLLRSNTTANGMPRPHCAQRGTCADGTFVAVCRFTSTQAPETDRSGSFPRAVARVRTSGSDSSRTSRSGFYIFRP